MKEGEGEEEIQLTSLFSACQFMLVKLMHIPI